MKRATALFLAMVMVFTLCACGSKELTAEEKEAIYAEIAAQKAAEKAKDETETAEVNQYTDNAEMAVEKFDVVVEDCAIGRTSSTAVYVKPCVRNDSDMDAAYIGINCELISTDGKRMRVVHCDHMGIASGASSWFLNTIEISNDEVSKLAEIKFSGGDFATSGKDGIYYSQTVRFAETTFTKEYIFGE